MSANSAVQHIAAGLAAYLSGQIVVHVKDGPLYNFNKVGLIAIAVTFISLWVAGKVKPAVETTRSAVLPEAGPLAADLLD